MAGLTSALGTPAPAWGKAWYANLERYGDCVNRLPRGRTHVRKGSVVDLQITPVPAIGCSPCPGAFMRRWCTRFLAVGQGRKGVKT